MHHLLLAGDQPLCDRLLMNFGIEDRQFHYKDQLKVLLADR
jgi:hypothetical protein